MHYHYADYSVTCPQLRKRDLPTRVTSNLDPAAGRQCQPAELIDSGGQLVRQPALPAIRFYRNGARNNDLPTSDTEENVDHLRLWRRA